MRRFLVRLLLAAVLGVVSLVMLTAARIVLWQKDVDAHYVIPDDIRVIGLGSSHTGCNISEDTEFKTKNFWCAARGALFSLMRLKELERRNQLSKVKYCLVDCGLSCMAGFEEDALIEHFGEELPMCWRYVGMMPVSKWRLFFNALLNAGMSYKLTDSAPIDEMPWTDRTTEDQARHIAKISTRKRSASSPPMCKDFEKVVNVTLDGIVAICKRYNIRVIFFASPTISCHPIKTDPGRYCEWQEVIDRLRKRGIEYYDFLSDCPDSWFRDADHLTRKGAILFTCECYKAVGIDLEGL